MLRWLLVSMCLLVTASGSAMGCNSGLGASDAKLRCEQEQASKADCVTTAAYDQCLKCVGECGDNCVAEAKCPEVYSCSADTTPTQ